MPCGHRSAVVLRTGDDAGEVVAVAAARAPLGQQRVAVGVELLHELLDALRLGRVPVRVDRDRLHLRRRHLDEALAHVARARRSDSVINAAGMRPTVVTKSVSAPGSISASELVGDLGDARLEAPHQAGPQRLHQDVADLAVARRIGEVIRLSKFGVAHRELPVGDRSAASPPDSGSRSRILCCAHSGSWCMTVAGSLASPIANPYWLENSSGLAADKTLVLPLREHPQAGRVAGRLVPVHRGAVPLRRDRRVHLRRVPACRTPRLPTRATARRCVASAHEPGYPARSRSLTPRLLVPRPVQALHPGTEREELALRPQLGLETMVHLVQERALQVLHHQVTRVPERDRRSHGQIARDLPRRDRASLSLGSTSQTTPHSRASCAVSLCPVSSRARARLGPTS